jgi:dynein heavy chain
MLFIASDGHWVILQNIHLVKTWLPALEKKIEEYSEGAHASYRIFLSAEPAPNPGASLITDQFITEQRHHLITGTPDPTLNLPTLYQCYDCEKMAF